MVNPYRFYTYAYLRVDRTPYYIGKGNGDRVYYKSRYEVKPPKDKSRIIFLKQNLTEKEAFKHEIYMIAVFGRKDLGTGILHNKTNGGEGVSGVIRSEEWKRRQTEAKKGKPLSKKHKKLLSELLSGENHPLYGVPCGEERKRKIGKKAKQRFANGFVHPNSKIYLLISPTGEKYIVFGQLKKFCDYKNISFATMNASLCYNRKGARRNGWTIEKIEQVQSLKCHISLDDTEFIFYDGSINKIKKDELLAKLEKHLHKNNRK
jgi:hypothetical protein